LRIERLLLFVGQTPEFRRNESVGAHELVSIVGYLSQYISFNVGVIAKILQHNFNFFVTVAVDYL